MLVPSVNIVIQYFYTLQKDHHDKSNCHLFTIKRYYITIDYVLTVIPILYVRIPFMTCNEVCAS